MTVGLRIQLWAQKVLTLEGVLPPYLLEIDLFYKLLRFYFSSGLQASFCGSH